MGIRKAPFHPVSIEIRIQTLLLKCPTESSFILVLIAMAYYRSLKLATAVFLICITALIWFSHNLVERSGIPIEVGNCSFSEQNQSNVHSWGIYITVANTPLCVLASTTTNTSVFATNGICSENDLDGLTLAQCMSRRGGSIHLSSSLPVTTQRLMKSSPPWTSQSAGNATLRLGRNANISFLHGFVTQGLNSGLGHFSLAYGSSLLRELKDAGFIRSYSWGLDAGSQSRLAPRIGSLVLGGYDDARIYPPIYPFTVNNPASPGQNRDCPLQVDISNVTLRVGGNVTKVTLGSLPSCIEMLVEAWADVGRGFHMKRNMNLILTTRFLLATITYSDSPDQFTSASYIK